MKSVLLFLLLAPAGAMAQNVPIPQPRPEGMGTEIPIPQPRPEGFGTEIPTPTPNPRRSTDPNLLPEVKAEKGARLRPKAKEAAAGSVREAIQEFRGYQSPSQVQIQDRIDQGFDQANPALDTSTFQKPSEAVSTQEQKNAETTSASPAVPEQGAPVAKVSVRVTAKSLRVRSADGTHICSVKRGTSLTAFARDGDEDRVKVRINSPGCPSEGYVYANHVMPDGDSWKDLITKVDADQLALRGEPSPDGSFKCGLKRNTEVLVVNDAPENADSGSWVQVSFLNPPKGCPSMGFVNSSYLQPSGLFSSLPILNEPDESAESPATEAGLSCPNGDCERGNAEKNLNDLRAATQGVGAKNPFVEELRRMIKNPKAKPRGFKSNRGLIQMPLLGNNGNIGACGSFHYNPDQPKGVDAYANPLTACAFTAFLQDWKKNTCPGGGGCRIAWGDISHKSKPRFNGHRSHTDGYCIDIRPVRKGAFQNAPLTYQQAGYDRETMKKLAAQARKFGADTMYFNDKAVGARYASGHHNHIHICFKPGRATRAACDNLTIDPNICPELM